MNRGSYVYYKRNIYRIINFAVDFEFNDKVLLNSNEFVNSKEVEEVNIGDLVIYKKENWDNLPVRCRNEKYYEIKELKDNDIIVLNNKPYDGSHFGHLRLYKTKQEERKRKIKILC